MDLTLSGSRLDAEFHVADSEFIKVAFGVGFKMLLFNPLVFSKKDLSRNLKYVVPTGRVKVPAGRYVVPTGKDNVINSTGRTKVIPAGSTILVLVNGIYNPKKVLKMLDQVLGHKSVECTSILHQSDYVGSQGDILTPLGSSMAF
ncbi:hypothetical protein Tco_1507014 [Tanacetum coccineum]